MSKKQHENATEAVRYIEANSYYEDNCNDAQEVVSVSDAIRATQLAELEALTFAYSVHGSRANILTRIMELKAILK